MEKPEIERSFALVQENQAVCSIVLPDDAPKAVSAAVSSFNETLKSITGAALPVSKADVPGSRIVLEVRPVTSLKTADNFAITFPDERTMKIEGTEISVQWAFNHLIRAFTGAEWILPENCGLSYTPMTELVIPAKKIEVGDISWPITRHHSVWTLFRMHNMQWGLRVDHDLTKHAFPNEKYGKDNSWPEAIMPVLNGKKITALPNPGSPVNFWQPCYSNPETAKIAIANLLEYLEKNPGITGLSLGSNDNGGYCECTECLKLDKGSRGNRSESYFTFINRVLEEVCKKYPDLIVSVFAYDKTYLPPSFKLHPNALPFLTIDFNSCIDPKLKEKHRKIIAEWGEKASMLGVWDYSWGYPYPAPRMYLPVHLEMLKFMADHNGKAYYGESWTVDANEGPKQYLIAKLLWDSNQDMKKLEEEWYVRCVGAKAAPFLKAYYKVWNDYYTGTAVQQTPWFKSAPSVYMSYYDNSNVNALTESEIQAADSAMKQVVALAETDQEKQRAEVLMRHWHYTLLRLRMLGAGMYDAKGFIHTPEQALRLLETALKFPEYQAEYKQINEKLIRERNLKGHYRSKPYLREGASPLELPARYDANAHILAASKFVDDPEVAAKMRSIADDPGLPSVTRQFCRILSEPEAQKNLLSEGDAEHGLPSEYSIHPDLKVNGELSVSDEHKAAGEKSFRVLIKGHDTLFWIHAKAKPSTCYLATFDAFIAEPSAEGYLEAFLYREKNGRNQQWRNGVPLKLSGGIWQTFSAMTATRFDSDGVQLRIYLRKFDRGDKIYIDNIRLTEIGPIDTQEKK